VIAGHAGAARRIAYPPVQNGRKGRDRHLRQLATAIIEDRDVRLVPIAGLLLLLPRLL
jgi:hypothetical protein